MNASVIAMFALACGGLGVIYALVTAAWVTKQSAGSEKMQAISEAIREGATAFLNREYKTVAIVAVVLAIVLLYLGKWTSIGFLIGVCGSALAGYIGMMVSVKANVRTTEAAKRGLQRSPFGRFQRRVGYRDHGRRPGTSRHYRLLPCGQIDGPCGQN